MAIWKFNTVTNNTPELSLESAGIIRNNQTLSLLREKKENNVRVSCWKFPFIISKIK